MNENENNFGSLRRVLALKRHETPPPGYFENFSREVTARIRAGEVGGTADVSSRLPWLFRMVSAFEAQPAFAGGFASVLCLLLLFGIVYAERPDMTVQPLMPNPSFNVSPLASVTAASLNPQSIPQPAEQVVWGGSSTNPVFNSQSAVTQPAAMFFGQSSATVQPLTFSMGN